ncbi:MAG: AAA family ATPase [Nitrospira sp.]
MQKLSDFKPLKRVVLPDLGELDCSGLVAVVGPNSSVRAIGYFKMSIASFVASRAWSSPKTSALRNRHLNHFLKCLEDEGYVYALEDESGNKRLRPRTMFLGTGQAVSEVPSHQAQSWYGAYSPDDPNSFRRQSEYLNYFGQAPGNQGYFDRRLTSLNPTGTIDFDNQPPQHDLHALYLNDAAREALFSEVLSSFGRAVWPDMSRGNQMCLKVSDEGKLPSPQDRLSHAKMAAFRSIEMEGDGMKSYLATCIALLLGTRPVCVIDEPEMCLHPPQAYNLGRFIGRYGANPECITLVATHSSHLLRGVIQTASKAQIVRLTRRDRKFSAHLVPAIELTQALSRPTLRAEAVLDGIFAQAVVVVEADGDRLVYQAAWETLLDEYRFDLHFSTVGGTGGIADTCRLYRTLKIPIAVVADLDMLVDPDRMKHVLEQLSLTISILAQHSLRM